MLGSFTTKLVVIGTSFISLMTPSQAVTVKMLDSIGFTLAHKHNIKGQGQHAVIIDTEMYLQHPAFKGAHIDKIYEHPTLKSGSEIDHGTVDLGEIIAQPTYNPESYGAAYEAKASVAIRAGTIDYTSETARKEFKKMVEAIIKTDARVITMSQSPFLWVDLAKTESGKKLLRKLFIEDDRILVLAAGNDRVTHGVCGKSKTMFVGENKKIRCGDEIDYPRMYTDKDFEEFKDYVIYVGNLQEEKAEKQFTKANIEEAIQHAIKEKKPDNFFGKDSKGYFTKAELAQGIFAFAFLTAKQNLSDFARAFLKDPILKVPQNYEEYEKGVDIIGSAKQHLAEAGINENHEQYNEYLESIKDSVKHIIKTEHHPEHLKATTQENEQIKNQHAKDLLIQFFKNVPSESWVREYIDLLCNKTDLYSYIKRMLEDGNPIFGSYVIPDLYPEMPYQLASSSDRAGIGEQHFIVTFGTNVNSTSGGFNGTSPSFKNLTGASQAAPLVASALLLGLQKYQGIKAKELIKKLYDSADHWPGLEYWYGQGALNVKRFLGLE